MKIVVLGATGYSGSRIFSELTSHKMPVRAAGRNIQQLRKMDPHAIRVSADNEKEVTALFETNDVVVNCIGPYSEFSELVINTAAKSGKTYLDLCGEQTVVMHSKRSLEQSARETGSSLVHACAMESAPADLLAWRQCQAGEPIEKIQSFYWFKPALASPGTRLTMRLAPGRDHFRVENSRLRKCEPRSYLQNVSPPPVPQRSSAIFAPLPEVFYFHERYHPVESASFFSMESGESRILMVKKTEVKFDASNILARHMKRRPPEPQEKHMRIQEYGVYVRIEQKERIWGSWLTGISSYRLTTAIISEMCQIMIETGRLPPGVHSPAEAFGDYDLLGRLLSRPELGLVLGDSS